MALSNYVDLKASMADWLHRTNLAAQIPDFIKLAEAVINRRLQIKPQEIDVPLVTVPISRYVALPADYGSPIDLWLEYNLPRTELVFMLPETLCVNTAVSGQPMQWAIDGSKIAFDRPADLAYPLTFRYVKDFGLSDANPTNDLLRRAPDLYLYGALTQAAPWIRDQTNLPMWDRLFEKAIREVGAENARNKAVPLRTEVPTSTVGCNASSDIYRRN